MKHERVIEDGKTYIQIDYYKADGETTVFPEYEMNVLENTQIEGMSKVIKRNIKGEMYFWFPVTTYITIKEKFNREYLDIELFCRFFEDLLRVYENMQTYLLDKNIICLEPEYIYFDQKNDKYVFLAIGTEQKRLNLALRQAKYLPLRHGNRKQLSGRGLRAVFLHLCAECFKIKLFRFLGKQKLGTGKRQGRRQFRAIGLTRKC